MKKTKEDATSAGTPKKKKPENKGRLSSMLESMQKRSSPVNAHKVATKYFDDFKKDRSIESDQETIKPATAVDTGVVTAKSSAIDTAVSSAVTTAVEKKIKKPPSPKSQNKLSGSKVLEDSHTDSESRVYFVMSHETSLKNSPQLRFGLKELKEKTGLSDKTIRNAIHSLEEKLSIKVVEPSLGVYGRKIQIFTPEEISVNRKKAKLVIDPTTKKIIRDNTAVSSTVDSAVTTAVIKTVDHKDKIIDLYKKYTGQKWDNKSDKFYKTIENINSDVIESVLILGVLKNRNKYKKLSDFKAIINDSGNSVPKTYLNHLRDIWNTRNKENRG